MGVFLVGAYQEILGDLHNLFGDTHAVHVNLAEDGSVQLTHVVEGDKIGQVLSYVQYEARDLLERLRISIEDSLKVGLLNPEDSARLQKRYKEALEGYTYLVK
jgi:arginine decarboxylase